MLIQKKNQISNSRTKILLLGIVLIASGIAQVQTLTLAQCIDTALQFNRNIKLSQHDVNIAAEKLKEVKGNLIPKLNGIVDYRYYTDLPYQLIPAAAFGGPAGTYKEVQFGVPQSVNANLHTVQLYNPVALSVANTTGIASELSKLQKIKTEEDVVLEVSNEGNSGNAIS
jgi:hypothetical protein